MNNFIEFMNTFQEGCTENRMMEFLHVKLNCLLPHPHISLSHKCFLVISLGLFL